LQKILRKNEVIAVSVRFAYFPGMISLRNGLVVIALFLTAGCTSYQMGGDRSGETGSYSGGTLNSPVTDQNPHVGGDQSYPSSDQNGREQVPLEKTGY
jgi:hypothetical protein